MTPHLIKSFLASNNFLDKGGASFGRGTMTQDQLSLTAPSFSKGKPRDSKKK